MAQIYVHAKFLQEKTPCLPSPILTGEINPQVSHLQSLQLPPPTATYTHLCSYADSPSVYRLSTDLIWKCKPLDIPSRKPSESRISVLAFVCACCDSGIPNKNLEIRIRLKLNLRSS